MVHRTCFWTARQFVGIGALLFCLACSLHAQKTTDRVPPAASEAAAALVRSPGGSSAGEMTRDEMVASLTSHRWCDSPSLSHDNPSPREVIPGSQLTLRRDGTYDLFEYKDTIDPPKEPGKWNIRKVGPASGVLYLGDSKGIAQRTVIVHFLSTDRVELHGLWGTPPVIEYLRCQPLAAGGAQPTNLPDISVEAAVATLGGTTWKLVSEVDVPFVPTAIEFLRDGRVHMPLRSEACKAFVPELDIMTGRILERRPDGTCLKERPYHRDSFRQTGRFVEHLSRVYLPEADVTSERYLFLPLVRKFVEGVVAYEPPLRRERLTARLELWNMGHGPAELARLRVSQVAFEGGTEKSRNAAIVPLEKVLEPGGVIRKEVTLDLVPPARSDKSGSYLGFLLEMPGRPDIRDVLHSF